MIFNSNAYAKLAEKADGFRFSTIKFGCAYKKRSAEIRTLGEGIVPSDALCKFFKKTRKRTGKIEVGLW